MSKYETVRVSAAMVSELMADDSSLVVVCGMTRYDDGTIDLIFKTPKPTAEMVERAARKLAAEFDYEYVFAMEQVETCYTADFWRGIARGALAAAFTEEAA